MAGTQLRIWRRSLTQVVLLLLGVTIVSAEDSVIKPQRVVSINLCADVLVLSLLPRERLHSISWLAAVSPLSPIRDEAQGIPVNHARLEELMVLQPDLVVARRGHASRVLQHLRQKGVQIHEVSPASTVNEAMQEWRALGIALGERDRAASLIDTARKRISDLPAREPAMPTATILGPGGYSYGKASLQHEILRVAGWDNLTGYVLAGYGGNLPLESLLLGQPDLIIQEAATPDGRVDTLGDRIMFHPALANMQTATVNVPSSSWACGGPEIVDTLERLSKERVRLGFGSQQVQ